MAVESAVLLSRRVSWFLRDLGLGVGGMEALRFRRSRPGASWWYEPQKLSWNSAQDPWLIGQRATEGFDGQPAVVVMRLQSRKGLRPAHKPVSRRAAMVLRDVHVRENRGQNADGGVDVSFFDIGMESVVHASDAGMSNRVHQVAGVLCRVQEIAFEAV